MNTAERNELLKLSDAAVVLYQHYISKSGQPNYDYSDRTVSKTLPWEESKIARVRKQLQKAGWFRKIDFPKASCGKRTTHHYIGPEAVKNSYHSPENLKLPQENNQ